MRLIDLTSVRQRADESVLEYIKKFRDVHSQCYSLSLSD